ncbi:MAG TPA: hypothetical protein VGQ83_27670 [Polyangia bacterium]|jgi:uncharacterized membrane protein
MSDIVCGDCGSPCPSTRGCPKCGGPVFDRATETGRAAAQTYVGLQGDAASVRTAAGLEIPLALLSLAAMAVWYAFDGWASFAGEMGVCLFGAAWYVLIDWNGERARRKAAARIAGTPLTTTVTP